MCFPGTPRRRGEPDSTAAAIREFLTGGGSSKLSVRGQRSWSPPGVRHDSSNSSWQTDEGRIRNAEPPKADEHGVRFKKFPGGASAGQNRHEGWQAQEGEAGSPREGRVPRGVAAGLDAGAAAQEGGHHGRAPELARDVQRSPLVHFLRRGGGQRRKQAMINHWPLGFRRGRCPERVPFDGVHHQPARNASHIHEAHRARK